MNNAPLMRVAVDSAAFFALSSDDIVQPDAAIAQLEGIAATLHELSDRGKDEFLTYVRHLAEAEEAETGRTARVEFLRSLGQNLGLC